MFNRAAPFHVCLSTVCKYGLGEELLVGSRLEHGVYNLAEIQMIEQNTVKAKASWAPEFICKVHLKGRVNLKFSNIPDLVCNKFLCVSSSIVFLFHQ